MGVVKNKLNICILSPTYHPKIGGAETYARNVAEGLVREGHNVLVITDGVGVDSPKIEHLFGVEVIRIANYVSNLDDPTKVRWEQMYFSLLGEIQVHLQSREIHLLHANSLDTAVLGSMIASTLNIPIVCTFHEQEPEKEAFGFGKCELVFSRLSIDLFIAGSQFYLGKALSFGIERQRIKLIYHGINLEKFFPQDGSVLRHSLRVNSDDFLIVCSARLKKRKGLLELICAMPLVQNTQPKAKLLIVGSCNSASRAYADLLYAKIKTLNLTNSVTINETFSFDAMPGLYAAADLVVQPSFAEGLGLAVIEGLACKKPVVASDIPGIQEIITHGQDGLLVPSGSPMALAKSIVQLIENPILYDNLSNNGLQLVRSHFDNQRAVRETLEAYYDCIDLKSKAVGVLS